MTWEEAQKYLNGPEVKGPVRAKVRREAWPTGHYVYRGGWPSFDLKDPLKVSYPGFAKVIRIPVEPDDALEKQFRAQIDTWRPSKDDVAATDWMLL